jgi:hypothetical protein
MIDLVAAGAGESPELDLALAWARGGESPAINVLLEMAFQVVGRLKSRVSGESRANSHSGGPGLSELFAVGKHRAPSLNRDRQ